MSAPRHRAPPKGLAPDEPKRLQMQPKEFSLQPLDQLNYADQRWQLEYMRLSATTCTQANFQNFVHAEAFARVPDFAAKFAPLYEHALDDYVRRDPCEVKLPTQPEMRAYYAKLATISAENELAAHLIASGFPRSF